MTVAPVRRNVAKAWMEQLQHVFPWGHFVAKMVRMEIRTRAFVVVSVIPNLDNLVLSRRYRRLHVRMMNSLYQRIAFWIVFVAFAASLGWMGYYHLFGAGYFRPVLVTPDKILHLGMVVANQPEEWEVSITNGGFRPLRIANVRSGCSGCIEILSYPREPIARGEKGVIRFALKTESLSGQVRKFILITSNDPRRSHCPILIDAFVKRENDDGVESDD